MRVAGTQFLAPVRREIDDQQPAARRQHPPGLGQQLDLLVLGQLLEQVGDRDAQLVRALPRVQDATGVTVTRSGPLATRLADVVADRFRSALIYA